MIGTQDSSPQADFLARTAAFYESVLGLHQLLLEKNLPGLEADAFRLSLQRGSTVEPVLELYVPDLQLAKAAVVSHGCQIEAEEAGPRCCIRDPFGLCFHLAQKA